MRLSQIYPDPNLVNLFLRPEIKFGTPGSRSAWTKHFPRAIILTLVMNLINQVDNNSDKHLQKCFLLFTVDKIEVIVINLEMFLSFILE